MWPTVTIKQGPGKDVRLGLRDASTSIPEIAGKLTIKTRKNPGRHVARRVDASRNASLPVGVPVALTKFRSDIAATCGDVEV
jgi:hypothetical protein